MVTRIHLECEGIPADFPIRSVTLDQDYDFADIGGQQFMLPLHSDVRSSEGRYRSWNEVSYSQYRKFGADASISFDTGFTERKPEEVTAAYYRGFGRTRMALVVGARDWPAARFAGG